MSGMKKADEAHDLQGPHWQRPVEVIGPAEGQKAVPPLRLVGVPRGRTIEIRRPQAVLGRHASVDVHLIQPEVSRRHCRLFHADEQWHVEDLGSTNGTYVNGERLEKAALLHQNDVIRLAAFLFQVDLGLAASPQSKEDRTENILRSIADLLPEEEREQQEPRRRSA
jgi:pSer/pThr/pTyr-binding forkhead associated (FHA) protein